jgi:hypothetical protein
VLEFCPFMGRLSFSFFLFSWAVVSSWAIWLGRCVDPAGCFSERSEVGLDVCGIGVYRKYARALRRIDFYWTIFYENARTIEKRLCYFQVSNTLHTFLASFHIL